ncbi:MAG: DUF1800 domain-containing protein [Pseudomonadota bacterium]
MPFRITFHAAFAAAFWVLPLGASALTIDEARHLLSRTGFGAAPTEIEALLETSREDAVDAILARVGPDPATPMPAWTEGWVYPHDLVGALGQSAEELFFSLRWIEIEELQAWWLGEMIATPSPLTERLTLFWHDHFATGFDDIIHPHWVADQNAFFRRHGAGNFADLAAGILADPAMRVYLTNTENHRDAPNENLAREYFELFTLGEGQGYTEEDVSEAARALTGYGVEWFGGEGAVFVAEAHDFGTKTILGQSGTYGAEDLPTIVLGHPAFGPYLVEKLWLTFVSDSPDPGEVARLTAVWRAADWEIKPLLREMFLSDAFWSIEARGSLVKGPVELIVSTIRSLGLEIEDLGELTWATEDLGQLLFFPPNVAGWPDGTQWINEATAGTRARVLTHLLEEARGPFEPPAPRAPEEIETVELAPADLRVGRAFAIEAEALEDGGAVIFLSLFDMGFRGEDWRSLSLWMEIFPGEDFALALHTADCAETCFARWPATVHDDPGWKLIEPVNGLRRDLSRMDEPDRALLAALLGHLPALLETTADQRAWTGLDYDGAPIEGALDIEEARAALTWLQTLSADVLGAPEGTLVLAPSRPGALGLGGEAAPMAMGEDAMEAYLEPELESRRRIGRPRVTYPTAQDWLAALPGTDFASTRAEAALLAIPLPDPGRRSEMVAQDADALIRRIVLSPYFQVH